LGKGRREDIFLGDVVVILDTREGREKGR